jgi:hypothetical protein
MKSRIRQLLMGDTVFTEYSKVTVPDDIQEKVYLEIAENLIEVDGAHWLLCIEPIVFGVWIKDGLVLSPRSDYRMYFDGVVITLDLVDSIEEKEGRLLLLKLRKTRLHQFNRLKNWLLYYRYYRRGGLSFDRFKAYVAAYSYPRKVRLVSFRRQDYFTIFPMDLLGNIPGSGYFVFGLRHTNGALPGIIETGKLAVSEVGYEHKDIIYQLGKHHSGPPPSKEELSFDLLVSKNFEFYIPGMVESYREVSIVRALDLGSHMLLWGKVVGEEPMSKPAGHLYLVHFLHYLYQKDKRPYRLV